MKKSHPVQTRHRSSPIEPLESRLTPGSLIVPHVIGIDRSPSTPDSTAGASVTYAVTFDQAVSGVDSGDFEVFSTGDVKFGSIAVAAGATGKIFNVTVSGLQGNGDIRLDLIDNDSITFSATPLERSFLGETYHVLQTGPKVVGITADQPTTTSANSVSWTVEFTETVTGVDPTDFQLTLTGPTANPVTVTPITGTNGTKYTVTAGNISGIGTAKLDLVDDGTIRDGNNNPLQTAPVSLAAPASQPASFGTTAIVSADLNGDGKADLVVANYGFSNSGSVTVLLGNGAGSFAPPVTVSTLAARSVAVGDFNGDGAPDLVVAGFGFSSSGASRAQVLIGNGSGGFSAPTDVEFGFGGRAVAVGDLDGDGRADLVVSSYTSGIGEVHVLLGNGNGTFQPEDMFQTGREPVSIAIGDINGDGRPDVAAANYTDNTVSVLLGDGAGNLAPQLVVPTGLAPRSVALGNLNSSVDNRLDLAVANNFEGTVSVMLGNGDGTFAARMDYNTGLTPASTRPSTVVIADMDGDGKLDLISASGGSGGSQAIPAEAVGAGAPVSVLLNQGNGTFGPATPFTVPTFSLMGLTIADFNGDGKADAAAANSSPGSAEVLLNNGNGNTAGPAYTIVAPFLDLSVSVTDGVTSIVTGDSLTYTLTYANNGSVDSTGVTLTAQLDQNLYFIASENPGWDRFGSTLIKTITGGLDAGETGTDTLKLHVNEVLSPFSSGSQASVTVMISDDGEHGTDVDQEDNSSTDSDSLSGDVYRGYVVTAPGIAIAKKFAPPVIRVFDRLSGAEVFTFDAYEEPFRASIRVALGDFNFDGVDDIVTTTQRGTGRLRIFDGKTGQNFEFGGLPDFAVFNGRGDKGAFVAVGDVNGFGRPEIVVGSALGGGKVRVFSLDNSKGSGAAPEEGFGEIQKIIEFNPFGPHFRGGVRVAVGDVNFPFEQNDAAPENGEGSSRITGDLIVGQGYFGGKVRMYDGGMLSDGLTPDESFIKELKVGGNGYRGGVSVGVGYVDSDNTVDLVVGRNSGKPSVAEVFSGRDLTPIGPAIDPFDEDPAHPKYRFGVRVATADVNGDGIADIIASVGIKRDSLVKFYDGAALREGNVVEFESRTIEAYSSFPNVALWVAGSTTRSLQV